MRLVRGRRELGSDKDHLASSRVAIVSYKSTSGIHKLQALSAKCKLMIPKERLFYIICLMFSSLSTLQTAVL
jgi:hypothetical protein